MVIRIARKEVTELWRDGRCRLAGGIVLTLLLASLAAGWRQYADLKAQHDTAQRAERAHWLAQAPKNPHQAAHYGVYAFKPKSQLSMIDTGIEPYVGVSVYLEAHKQNAFKFRPAQDASTSIQRFGQLTAWVVLQLLVPLLIVLLTFAAFAGEREQGTLRQLLSLGVSARTLASGKALGIASALASVLVPATIIGVGALVLTSSGGLLATDVSRAALMTVAYLAYFLIFLGLSLAVSVRSTSTRATLAILLAFWIANGLIAARGISDVAGYLYPTPSDIEFDASLQADLTNTAELDAKLARLKSALFERYGVETLDALPINFRAIALQEGEEHGYQIFEKHFGAVFDQFERQNAVHQWGGLAAPLLAMRSLSMTLAGTDFVHHRHFTAAAEDYRRTIIKHMNNDLLVHPLKAGEEYAASHALWQQVPAFRYEAPGALWALGHDLPGLYGLGAWLAITATTLILSLRRLEA